MWVDECRGCRRPMNMLQQNVAGRIALERHGTGRQLVEDHSKGIQIAPVRACKALRNLRGEVRHLMEWESQRIQQVIQPKIGEFWFSWGRRGGSHLAKQNRRRGECAMNDGALMGVVKRVGKRGQQVH